MLKAVQIIDGKAVTTSRKIAEIFEKQHKDILRAIRELEIPADYRERNFAPSVYEQPNPSGGKPIQHPEYLITRDGFTILAMGFTGKKAMEFKIAFINAFNTMEECLKQIAEDCQVQMSPPTGSKHSLRNSTFAMLDKINHKIIAGEEVDRDILQYAWNVGRLFGKELRRAALSDAFTEFVQSIAPGRYCRSDIYDMYCSRFSNPMNARWFWPRVRSCRACTEMRDACNRYVVFE